MGLSTCAAASEEEWTMSREPLLSVVIPTRGAPPSLARTLHCLASQTLALCDYEVVVVDR